MGSSASFRLLLHVRLHEIATEEQAFQKPSLSAISGLMHRSKKTDQPNSPMRL